MIVGHDPTVVGSPVRKVKVVLLQYLELGQAE